MVVDRPVAAVVVPFQFRGDTNDEASGYSRSILCIGFATKHVLECPFG